MLLRAECHLSGALEIKHISRGLRTRPGAKTRGEKTVWFSSAAVNALEVPPDLREAKVTDLYVHQCGNGTKQVWLLDANRSWLSIDLLHPHPHLEGYMLNLLNNGEPSWVTRETVRTYQGRIMKAARDAAAKSTGGAK